MVSLEAKKKKNTRPLAPAKTKTLWQTYTSLLPFPSCNRIITGEGIEVIELRFGMHEMLSLRALCFRWNCYATWHFLLEITWHLCENKKSEISKSKNFVYYNY